MPMKKDDNMRFCGNYRPLNARTWRDSFPMPLINDVLDQLGKFAWFATLDLQFGFQQIPIAPKNIKKIVVITNSAMYDWSVMPFGLKNAINIFSQTMAIIFKDWKNKFIKVFVDDGNIHNLTWRDHLQHIRMVFHRLKKVHLKLNLNKCYFGAQSITFLGHVVSIERSYPNYKKIIGVENFPIPRTITNVRAFLGLIGYYHKFIPRYTKIAEPFFLV